MDNILLPNGASTPPRMYRITSHLYAGFYPGDLDRDEEKRKLSWLLDEGVTVFINLTEPSEYTPGGQKLNSYRPTLDALAKARGIADIRALSFPIRDVSVPTPERMAEILDAIDLHIAEGKKIYVHCLGGRGRTGTVVGCWLIRHGWGDGKKVLERLEVRSRAANISYPCPESYVQRRFVLDWPQGR